MRNILFSVDKVDKLLDGLSGTYYRARFSILSNEEKYFTDNFRLVSGMLLTDDIRAGHRDTPEEGADKIIAWLKRL